MSEQAANVPSSTKQRRSRKTKIANQEAGGLAFVIQRPTDDDKEAWKVYWNTQGQPWRSEPEIDMERQKYLSQRRNITPDIEQGIYQFKDIKLSRADVEWLLATLEDGRGPIFWDAGRQRPRNGLDLRGADLREVDLQNLPLSRMLGGLTVEEWENATPEQRETASAHLEGASLRGTHLNDSFLRSAHFEKADLHWTHLEGTSLGSAHFEGASLRRGRLQGAYLQDACLQGADLHAAHLEGANLKRARLAGAILELAFFDSETNLQDISLGRDEKDFVSLVDVHWGGVNLAVVDWYQLEMLGEEQEARAWNKSKRGKTRQDWAHEKSLQREKYWIAIRANRQLANELREQGLNEYARMFGYQAQILRRKVLWLQAVQPEARIRWRVQKLGAFFSSLFFDLLAAYGYSPLRSAVAYLFIIVTFSIIYFVLGFDMPKPYHLAWYEALMVSLTAFHGRGFFSNQFTPGDPQSFVAATEAVIGLLIEISFIATFTQRFFDR